MVVIDDSQRLGNREQTLSDRLPTVADELQDTAIKLDIPLLAVWPDLGENHASSPYAWGEKVPAVDAILMLEQDSERTKKLTEPNRAMILHVVKNRGGEKGKLAFDFYPAFSKFSELSTN